MGLMHCLTLLPRLKFLDPPFLSGSLLPSLMSSSSYSASEMTYIVSSGALNSTHSLTHHHHSVAHRPEAVDRHEVRSTARFKTSDVEISTHLV